MGAYTFLQMNIENFPMKYISRPARASTATGFAKKHAQEQQALVELAFS